LGLLTAAAASADSNYNGLNPDDVSVTNSDDDTPGISVNPTSGLITTEAGEATIELEHLESDGMTKKARAYELRSKVEALLSRTGADDPQSLKGLLSQWEGFTRRRELLLTQSKEIEGEEGQEALKRAQEALDRRRREVGLGLKEEGLLDFRPSIEEEEGWIPTTRKKGPSRRISKQERKRRVRTRKL